MIKRRDVGVTVRQAIKEAIGIAEKDITPAHEARMRMILWNLGMRPETRDFGGTHLEVWRKPKVDTRVNARMVEATITPKATTSQPPRINRKSQ